MTATASLAAIVLLFITVGAKEQEDKLEKRVMLLEAGQAALQEEYDKLKTDNILLRSVVSDQQQEIQRLESFHAAHVIFHVMLGRNTDLPDGEHVILKWVSVNAGGAYNSSSGEFTVPVNGYYFFNAHATAYSSSTDSYAGLQLRVDAEKIVNCFQSGSSVGSFSQSVCSHAGHFRGGQRVWLRGLGNKNHLSDALTWFTGFLVRAD